MIGNLGKLAAAALLSPFWITGYISTGTAIALTVHGYWKGLRR